ncbi:MAG TPA: hypothetical protein VJ063_18205 [Verrucomicrobiae bacterium]|nr:hypothetical protein [Verrucomicrobiae bacterium]
MDETARINWIQLGRKKVQDRQSRKNPDRREPLQRWCPAFHAKELRRADQKLKSKNTIESRNHRFFGIHPIFAAFERQ